MVPLKILPVVPLVANDTIGNSERFAAANDTIGANFTIGGNFGTNGTIGSPNGTIVKPNNVNSNIMIDISNLFLYSYFYVYISVFLLFANSILIKTVLICEINI